MLDVNVVIDKYLEIQSEGEKIVKIPIHDADDGDEKTSVSRNLDGGELIIERNLKGVDYQFAKCCEPQKGDEIFAFVTISGGIKIHKKNCPNALDLQTRFGYRILRARWKSDETE